MPNALQCVSPGSYEISSILPKQIQYTCCQGAPTEFILYADDDNTTCMRLRIHTNKTNYMIILYSKTLVT